MSGPLTSVVIYLIAMLLFTVAAVAARIGLQGNARAAIIAPLLRFLCLASGVAVVCLVVLFVLTMLDQAPMVWPIFWLFVGDAIVACAALLALIPLALYKHAAYAVLKRNFVGYFSNPTGYVFLCLFVLMTSFAAFWPHEFFNANLANLDQLNQFLPLIMLVFVPAITMGIWAEERRQGTD